MYILVYVYIDIFDSRSFGQGPSRRMIGLTKSAVGVGAGTAQAAAAGSAVGACRARILARACAVRGSAGPVASW